MGTPLVSQDCAAELGNALQVSVFTARKLIADALTIRHRLPLLWQRVKDGEVWGWKAAKIAEASRHLGGLSSWALDRQVTPHLELMAWTRFLDVLDAALLRVDEATYQARAEAAAAQRDVRSYRGQYGLRTLVARAEAGDVAAFEALVDLVAQCLAEEGDEDPVGVRRSTKALGVIGHQARLRDLLARHADQPDDPRHPEDRVAAYRTIRPIRGPPMISHPLAGRPLGTATTTNPAPTMETSTTPGPAAPTTTPIPAWDEEPVDPADQDWLDQQPDDEDDTDTASDTHAAGSSAATDPANSDNSGEDSETARTDGARSPAGQAPTPIPAAFDRDAVFVIIVVPAPRAAPPSTSARTARPS